MALVETFSKVELMAEACKRQNDTWENICAAMNAQGYNPNNAIDIVNANFKDVLIVEENLGGGAYISYYPKQQIENIDKGFERIFEQLEGISNSNNTSIVRADVKPVVNIDIDDSVPTQPKTKFSMKPISGGIANAAATLYTVANQAVMGVTAACFLGKTLDTALYNIAPDYWDSIGASSLNPETWNSITSGYEGIAGDLFNILFQISPDGTESKAYVDQNALAYMAYLLQQNDWFSSVYGLYDKPENFPYNLKYPFVYGAGKAIFTFRVGGQNNYVYEYTLPADVKATIILQTSYPFLILASDTELGVVSIPYTRYTYNNSGQITETITGSENFNFSNIYTFNNLTVYRASKVQLNYPYGNLMSPFNSDINIQSYGARDIANYMAWLMIYNGYYGSSIPGVSDQPNAILPDISTWTDIPTTLQSLQQQYPDTWTNPLIFNQLQPDGTVQPITYVPIPFPNAQNALDSQPTTGSQTQTDTDINNLPDTLLQNFLKMIQTPISKTGTETLEPPQNPTDTGDGSSPIPVPPTGTASALWSVYHPTAAQINSFGAWLWTDNIIQQFIQALNNPMDGIITLHKIFAQPIDSGTGTIVIGRLDSEVPTATVNEQYVSVDCGTIDINEYFGNIFDYIGTEISIYLPFIGIVPLNVQDIMRSTINVKYNVDVFTGACLATINVQRDGYNPLLYQYSGVCSVEYPLTGGQHSGLINGIFGMASSVGSIVAGVATANPLALAGGAMGVASSATGIAGTQNARSGAFGANAGAMGIKKPYVIISRPQTKIADNDNAYTGYSTNKYTRIGDCSGLVKCRQLHVNGINATQQELEAIQTLLQDGILLSD